MQIYIDLFFNNEIVNSEVTQKKATHKAIYRYIVIGLHISIKHIYILRFSRVAMWKVKINKRISRNFFYIVYYYYI